MTHAASSSKVHPSIRAAADDCRTAHALSVWQVLAAVSVALLGFLTLTPDGIAEPLQDFAGCLLVGGVASLALIALATGLGWLLDCKAN